MSANRLGPECFGLTVFDEFLSLFVLSSIHISFDKSIYFYPDEYGSRALDHAFFRFLSRIPTPCRGPGKETKLKNGRVGKEIKLVGTLYTPVSM